MEGWWTEADLKEFINEPPEAYYYLTVSYLIHKDDEHIMLARDIKGPENKGHKYGELFRIPVSAIRELRIIEDGDEEVPR